MSNIIIFWKRLSPAWRYAIGAVVIARIALSLWSLVVYSIFPQAVQNLDLFGDPVLSIFDLRTGDRYLYSRWVDGSQLSFHVIELDFMADDQTGSIWSIRDGRAIEGGYAGTSLGESKHSVEEIFPYEEMPPSKNLILSLWQRFDVNWYLGIATRGYEADGSTVYFPLYPALIRVLAFVVDPLLAATLISNFALMGSLVLLYKLTLSIFDDSIARRTMIYSLFFPTAFFLTCAYTESLFLIFTLASFFAASRGRWAWVALWGVLSALTRLQGVLIIIPLAYLFWREMRGLRLSDKLSKGIFLLVIPLATITFLSFTNQSILNTYQGTLHAKFVFPWNNILAAFSLLVNGEAGIIDTLNLSVTLGLMAMIFVIWKKLPFEYTLYSILMLAAPTLRMTTTQPLVSMTRYALAMFPVFMILGIWGKNRWVNRVIVYISLLLQVYLSAQFILWGWVG